VHFHAESKQRPIIAAKKLAAGAYNRR